DPNAMMTIRTSALLRCAIAFGSIFPHIGCQGLRYLNIVLGEYSLISRRSAVVSPLRDILIEYHAPVLCRRSQAVRRRLYQPVRVADLLGISQRLTGRL
ncbi:MAG: hypothetical protein ACUVSX_16910, partial [Aggregatilineales bacterium]